jgi:DNA repair protein SbcC/Rad50
MKKHLGKMRMRIREINIKNFRGYGENTEDRDGFFKFDHLDEPDIILITGHNGYGKTSLYEAVEWCLTDDIKALRKFTEDVNQKTTLKKSNYLKFQSLYDKREREVEVRIVFDNGHSLIRKTIYASLHDDNYRSFTSDETGNLLKEDEIREFVKCNTGQPLEKFFRLSFCGQAFSEDLIRDTSAKGRGEILLSYLGMDVMNDLLVSSDAKKNPSLNAKLRAINIDINDKYEAKEKLDKLFKINDWGNIESYKKLVSNRIQIATNFHAELQESNITSDFQFQKESITEIVDTFDKAKILKERLVQFYEADKQERNCCIKDRLISEYKKNQIFLQSSDIVVRLNIVNLQEELTKVSTSKEAYEKTISVLEEERRAINSRCIQLQDDSEVFFLTEEIIRMYNSEMEMYQKLYSDCLNYGLNLEKGKFLNNLNRLLRHSETYRSYIIKGDTILEEKRQALKTIEGICDSQKEMLLKVQTFVNHSEMIDKCPVCGGTDFIVEGESAKDRLLTIIGNEISKGDVQIKTYNDDVLALEIWIERVKKSYKDNIWNKYTSNLLILESEINECINMISEYIQGMILCNNKMMNNVNLKLVDLQNKVKKIDEFLEKYCIEKSSFEEKIEKVKKRNRWIEDIMINKFQIRVDTDLLDEVIQKKFRPIIRKINLEQKSIKILDDIIQYDIGVENFDLLQKCGGICKSEEKLVNLKDLYQAAVEFRSNVNGVSKNIQTDLIHKYIENNELINIIYKFVNPHPFLREIRIDKSGAETNIMSMEKGDIYLDHVFSEAQMRVLSLSIFLGLNLSVKSNNFNQIYIDDPVQSMDDINMVSFIDLLRALKASNSINKNFIIGTHDDNFSKLLKIKFRHHSFIEYRLDSYTKEGPKLLIIDNKNYGRK